MEVQTTAHTAIVGRHPVTDHMSTPKQCEVGLSIEFQRHSCPGFCYGDDGEFIRNFLPWLIAFFIPKGLQRLAPGRVRAPGGICEISIDPEWQRREGLLGLNFEVPPDGTQYRFFSSSGSRRSLACAGANTLENQSWRVFETRRE